MQSFHSTTCHISKCEHLNSVDLMTTVDDLQECGIDYGDALEITFSNGYIARDVPLYTKCYENCGGYVATAEIDRQIINFRLSYYEDTWDIANLSDQDMATIKLMDKGRYRAIQQIMSLDYSDDLRDYANEEEFANFRPLKGGNLKDNEFYIGSSTCNNLRHRSNVVNQLCETYNISYFVDMTNNNQLIEDNFSEYGTGDLYFAQKYWGSDQKCIDALNINTINIKSKDNNSKTLSALLKIAKNDSKVYFYSTTGIETTSYFYAVILSLAGASYSEIVDNYMQTYYNYFDVDQCDNNTYESIKKYTIDDFLHKFTKTDLNYDLSKCDYAHEGEMYLRSTGMSGNDIQKIIDRISK